MKNLNLKYQLFSKVFSLFLVGVFMIIAPVFAQTQNKTITGVVMDNNKMPLSGVSIAVKGGKVGTQTDFDGKYSIQAGSTDQLVFTYVGFESRTITVGDKTNFNMVLQSSSTNLEELVVIGYGSVKKKDLTGSVGKVNIADMNKAPVASFDQALAGRVAGVQVTSADGQPGAGIDIVIRGANSVTGANSPLYVIDGFLIENPDTNSINPAEIESMEILKDASATAIYGARGANGVVVITTKKGKAGKPVFSFNSTTGTQVVRNPIELLSPYEYIKYQIDYTPSAAIGATPRNPIDVYLISPNKTLDYYKGVKAVDWFKESIRTGLYSSNDFAVRGGLKKLKYSLSGSHVESEGVMINTDFRRNQARVILDYQVTNKLNIGINTNYSDSRPGGLTVSEGGYNSAALSSIWGYRPVPDPVNDITEQFEDPDMAKGTTTDNRVNPKLALQNAYNVTKNTSLAFNGYLDYSILKDLKFRSTYGYTENQSERTQFFNNLTAGGRGSNGVNGSIDTNTNTTWLNENTLTWDKKLDSKSKLNVLGGATFQSGKSWYEGQRSILIPGNSIEDMDLGSQVFINPTSSNWSMASFLSRINYSYDSKYLFTLSFRADGSSKFPSENHWGYFPSTAFAWNVKQENFLKNVKSLSELKFRTSWGKTGNNRVSGGDFPYLDIYSDVSGSTYFSYPWGNEYARAVYGTALGNSDLKWETTEQVDAGLDLGFFKQRIGLVVDVYRKRTYNLLLNADLPPSSGYISANKNIGSVENKGLEITLTTKNIVTKDFTWTSSANITFNKNKLLGLNEGQTSFPTPIIMNGAVVANYNAIVGQPLGNMYGIQVAGTYKYSDFNATVDANGSTVYTLKPGIPANTATGATNTIKPGDIKYVDVDGDGKTTNADAVVVGNGLPVHFGGFSNNFTYKGFDLNVFFQWSYGNDINNINRINFGGLLPANAKNQWADVANRWTPDNPYSDIPRAGVGANFNGTSYATNYGIEDGSYLRLKTVSFGYNINSELVSKWHLKSLRFSLSAQNLITWTRYSGLDPEVNGQRNVLRPGYDLSSYPRARTLTFGTNISF